MSSWAERWKPAAGVRTHLLAAALLWTAVGAGLSAAGIVWCFSARRPWVPLALGVCVGVLKGIFIIARLAARNARRNDRSEMPTAAHTERSSTSAR